MAEEAAHDYSEDVDRPTVKVFEQIDRLCQELIKRERAVEKATADLEVAKKMLEQVQKRDLPELMKAIGQKHLETMSGLVVKLRKDIRCGLPSKDKDPERRAAALKYLEQEGYEDLIKNSFTIKFDREDIAWANKFEAQMKRRKRQLDYARTRDVHFETLGKWARDRLEAGKVVPNDVFNFYEGSVAHVEAKK